MTKIPHAGDVTRALLSVHAATHKSQKGLNQVASQRMSKGDYATAEKLMAKGKELSQFRTEVETLRNRWRELYGSRGESAKEKSITPLWVYYQPILEALEELRGEARIADLENKVESLMAPSLLPEDSASMARGRERWRVMIRRARKPMVAEGWIAGRVNESRTVTQT